MDKKEAEKNIAKLSGWLAAGLLGGICMVAFFLYFRGTFNGVFFDGSLPSAEKIRSLTLKQDGTRYTFERIDFLEYDSVKRREVAQAVSLGEYQSIIDALDWSTPLSREDYLLYKFEQENKATLTIYLRPENNESETLSLPYQTIQFLKNSDYFRIDAPDKEGPYIWDYYRSARAYDKVKEILERASTSLNGGQ